MSRLFGDELKGSNKMKIRSFLSGLLGTLLVLMAPVQAQQATGYTAPPGPPYKLGAIFVADGQTSQSVFVGLSAGLVYPTNTDMYGSVGFGTGALQSLVNTATEDSAFGVWSCQYFNGYTSTCIGMHAMGSELSGSGYTALGNDAMRDTISTDDNVTAIGHVAVKNGAPGTGVTAVGALALHGNSASIVLSGTVTTGDVVQVVLSSVTPGLTGLPLTAAHTAVGGDTLSTIATDLASQINHVVHGPSYPIEASAVQLSTTAANNIVVMLEFPGTTTSGWALTITPTVTGAATETVAIGGGSTPSLSTAVGYGALYGPAMTNAANNVAVGYQTGYNLTTGGDNILIGVNSGKNLTTGHQNVFIGSLTGSAAGVATNFDIGIGYQALQNVTTGNNNVMMGYQAGIAVTTSINNTAIGYQAGVALTTGSGGNTLLGRQAGSTITTGTNNVILGFDAAHTTLSTGSNNILIGTVTDTLAAGTGNEINIGGLIFYNNASTAVPVLSACGTGSPTVDTHGNNRSGTITAGAGALGSCTMTFAGSGYTTWNHCRVTSQTTVAAFAYTYGLTTITVAGTSITGDKFDYDCDGY